MFCQTEGKIVASLNHGGAAARTQTRAIALFGLRNL